jgi:hypothetical protein
MKKKYGKASQWSAPRAASFTDRLGVGRLVQAVGLLLIGAQEGTFCRCGQSPSRAIEDNGSFRYAFRELAKRYHPDPVARVAYLSFGTSSKLITSCPIMSEETTIISGCATPKNSRTAIQYSFILARTNRYSALLSRLPLAFFMTRR